jgi:hypothetical protein
MNSSGAQGIACYKEMANYCASVTLSSAVRQHTAYSGGRRPKEVQLPVAFGAKGFWPRSLRAVVPLASETEHPRMLPTWCLPLAQGYSIVCLNITKQHHPQQVHTTRRRSTAL